MMKSSMVTRLLTITGVALFLSSRGVESASLRASDADANDFDGEGMSGALVGGLPDDDVLEEDEELDKAHEAPRGATAFHRTGAQKHLRQSSDDDDDKEDKEDDADDEEAVALARSQKMHAEAELKSFEDDALFDKSLASDVAKIGNETQSPALAKFLGEMKDSQRNYARPEYIDFLKKQIKEAEKTIKKSSGEADESEEKKAPAPSPKKDAKDDDDDEGAKEKLKDKVKEVVPLPSHQSAGETFAIAFFANVAMLACVFAMAATDNKEVKNYTWFLIDTVVAIFLAVMHFQAFDSMMNISALGVGSHVAASVVHTLCLLFLVLGIAYWLQKRGDKNAVAVLCGAGAHFVSFSSIHSSTSMQNKVFVAASYTVTMCVVGLLVLGLGIGIIAVLVYKAKQRAKMTDEERDEYMDKSDDVENDAGATAFSVVFTMLIRFVLTGHHPEDDETDFDHTARQRNVMLAYAFICLIVAGVGSNFIARKCPDNPKPTGKEYALKRVCNFFKTVLAMNTAWAFLYWGEWEFFEALYPNDPIKGRVMFAVVVTMLGGILLLGLSKIPDKDKADERTKQSALTALGLVIAFSWELTFDSAIEQMVDGQAHPVVMKVLACVVMLVIIVPVYVLYMKPIVLLHSIGD